MLLKSFWVVARRRFFCVCPNFRDYLFVPSSGSGGKKIGQRSNPETLVIHQKTTAGNNPEDFKQANSCSSDQEYPDIL
jgi:hypothetical protein